MSQNTAKTTDPIWDSRNSDEPDFPPHERIDPDDGNTYISGPDTVYPVSDLDKLESKVLFCIKSWFNRESVREVFAKYRRHK